MQDGQKSVWSIPYISVAFCPILKQNFIAYHSSKVTDCIFETHQLWQSGFSKVYSNSCWSRSFESEIIKIRQSSHKMYSNNILNFQESTTILNAHMKKVWKFIVCTSYLSIFSLYYYSLWKFFTLVFSGGFPQSFRDSQSPHVSSTLPSILVNLNNTAVCMVVILPLISNYSCLFFTNTLTTIGIIVNLMFHNFFISLAGSKYFVYLFVFLHFYSVVHQNSKIH